MNNTKTLTLTKSDLKKVALFVSFLTLAIVAPLFKNQFITGPLVNALLFLSVGMLGIRQAVVIALFPSLVSLAIGLLPVILAPMIPFIMLSNVFLIFVFDLLEKKNYWVKMVIASLLKFMFLLLTSGIILHLINKKELMAPVSYMLGWPQLVTALIGGVIAWGILRKR